MATLYTYLPMISTLLYVYGTFLILCGIISVIFIGLKAKTALMSGGMSGLLAILIGYFISTGSHTALILGTLLTLGLFIVFAWRSTKTLVRIFELLAFPSDKEELKGKGIAFMIISLMAVVSIVVTILQIATYLS
jgi:hypothetical protein